MLVDDHLGGLLKVLGRDDSGVEPLYQGQRRDAVGIFDLARVMHRVIAEDAVEPLDPGVQVASPPGLDQQGSESGPCSTGPQ
jgi:hypothetical protein